MCRKVLFSIGFLLLFSIANAQSLTERNLGAIDELEAARDILDSTELDLGRYHMGLVEPLEQLADRLMSLNQFDEADDMLDRAVQITRIYDGLHTPVQLSLIKKRIDNFSNRAAWDDARDLMEYLFSYYLRVPVLLNENLIEDFLILAEQHLRGVTEAPEEEQGFHFYRAHQLNWAMISTAKKLYGESSPELVPLLYRQVQHFYMHRKIHDNVGAQSSGLRRSLRDTSRRDRMVSQLKRVEIERIYYFEGLALLDEIGNIFTQGDVPNHMGQAMTQLYLADWLNLFDYAEDAASAYASAYKSLRDAGASPEQLNELFNLPKILPVQSFYASVDEAVNDPVVASALTNANAGNGIPQFVLTEWSTAIPTVRSPLNGFEHEPENSAFALFDLELRAENESTFFYKHQYRQSIGTASEQGLVRGFPDIASGSEEALMLLDQIRFRPKLVEGEPVASQIQLRYEIATEREY